MPPTTENLTQSLEVTFSRRSVYLTVWNFTCSLASIGFLFWPTPDDTELIQVSIYCFSCVNHQCRRERGLFWSSSWDAKLWCLTYEPVRIAIGNRKVTFVLLGSAIYSKCKKYAVESIKLNPCAVNVTGWPLHPRLLASKERQHWPSRCLLHCQLTDRVSEHAPMERVRAAPRQGWMWQITQLVPPGSGEVNTSHSQSAPANLTYRKVLGQ